MSTTITTTTTTTTTTTPESLRKLSTGLIFLCILGTILSYYAFIVETTKERDQSYEALCDINEYMSCSRVVTSGYGKGLGLIPNNSLFYFPNSLYGLGFYLLIAGLSMINEHSSVITIVFLGILSNICSVYLAYILYLLRSICVICISTYIINAFILILGLKKLRILGEEVIKKPTKKKVQ
ncbi:PREDICTED: vitamin K epoxide reductase complex subunit 1-like protein 1 [Polistes dominula]|uniref:vitamin-K-epoxide reductase (warfarin-sensitive) n=1 Tax=Polistes dominula TaxID=743375 RepID=A0ABM1ID12_POLDO|nr:PREDICTED: vitamin K epoxide reductase complex subunit 1-like protein 1 [Polistes dominula]